ncbi:uncharacterized protein LOC129149544 [Eptesicus fuscus]|uniref:uncharacterized protein LOC129149544 n=1 Tax=Eptesicus fuscus TaxID=29078 RepID=UPI0024045560|nr:uncharacterized protein LOC129149544 [Eptesicus fuscus]
MVTVRRLNINFGSDYHYPATSSQSFPRVDPVTCRPQEGTKPRTPLIKAAAGGGGRAVAGAGIQRPERPRGTQVLPGHSPGEAAAPPPRPTQRGPSGPARNPRGPREWGSDRVAGLEPGVPIGPAGSQVAGSPSRDTFRRLTWARPFLSRRAPSRWPSADSRQHRADTPAAAAAATAATAARGELEHWRPDSAAPSTTLRTEHAHTQTPRAWPGSDTCDQQVPAAPPLGASRSPRLLGLAPPPRSPADPAPPRVPGSDLLGGIPAGVQWGARSRESRGWSIFRRREPGAGLGLAAGLGGCSVCNPRERMKGTVVESLVFNSNLMP